MIPAIPLVLQVSGRLVYWSDPMSECGDVTAIVPSAPAAGDGDLRMKDENKKEVLLAADDLAIPIGLHSGNNPEKTRRLNRYGGTSSRNKSPMLGVIASDEDGQSDGDSDQL